jgi:DnaJ-class molecular chaperone
MKIPPATSSARTFRLRNCGMPKPKNAGAGDQLVKVKIVMPSSLTEEETALYQKLKALRTDNPRAYQG